MNEHAQTVPDTTITPAFDWPATRESFGASGRHRALVNNFEKESLQNRLGRFLKSADATALATVEPAKQGDGLGQADFVPPLGAMTYAGTTQAYAPKKHSTRYLEIEKKRFVAESRRLLNEIELRVASPNESAVYFVALRNLAREMLERFVEPQQHGPFAGILYLIFDAIHKTKLSQFNADKVRIMKDAVASLGRKKHTELRQRDWEKVFNQFASAGIDSLPSVCFDEAEQ